jgi:hypothetical protein
VSATLQTDVFCKTRHESELLDLRSEVWGAQHPHTTLAFSNWLFAATPPGEPIATIVRLHGRVVGSAGLCRKRILVEGRSALLAHGLDYMLAPDLKGLAIGHASIEVARHWLDLARSLGCALGLVFPNENSHRILTSTHVGLKPMFQPALMIRPLQRAALTRDIKGVPRRLGTAALRIAALYGSTRSVFAGGKKPLRFEAHFGPEYDALWASLTDKVGIGVVRDSSYLNWRYVDHPVYRYERLCLKSDGELRGFVIGTRRETFGIDSMLLVDLVAKNANDGVSCELIEGFVHHADSQTSEIVVTLAIPGSSLYNALKRCGFLAVPFRLDPKPFRTASAVFSATANCAWDPSRWYFTWGDIDVV